MPESPEVQALVDFMRTKTVGRRIQSIDVRLPKALKTTTTPAEAVNGCLIADAVRHGKMLDLVLRTPTDSELHLIVHWGHDGWLAWHQTVPEGNTRTGDAALIARVRLDDGSGFDLTDAGQWKALAVFVVHSPADVPAIARLGPDPVDPAFARDDLARLLSGRRKQLKALLQDQGTIAGIGNAYSDEILHAARLSPLVHAATLIPAEIDRLFAAVRDVMQKAIVARRGLLPEALKDEKRTHMRVHRRPGEACPACGDTVIEFAFSGASAHWCPTCQDGGDAPTP